MEIINPTILNTLDVSGSVQVQGSVTASIVQGVVSQSNQIDYLEIPNAPRGTFFSSSEQVPELSGSIIEISGDSLNVSGDDSYQYFEFNGFNIFKADFQFTDTGSYLELAQLETGSSGTFKLHSNYDNTSSLYEWNFIYDTDIAILSQSFSSIDGGNSAISLILNPTNGIVFSDIPTYTVSINSIANIYGGGITILNSQKEANNLLNLYPGSTAAYSLRLLDFTYTGAAVRVRNDSDAEEDIGFDEFGNLDTGSLETHCGAGSGYVVKWYDQSGEGNDAVQAATASQPKIYSSGATILEVGKPAIDFDGSNDFFNLTDSISTSQANTSFFISRRKASSTYQWGFAATSVAPYSPLIYNNNYLYFYGSSGYYTYNTSFNNNNRNLLTGVDPYTTYPDIYINGVLNATTNASGTVYGSVYNTIGFRNSSGTLQYSNAVSQELIFYPQNKDTDGTRSGIEENINNYYNIYA